MTKAEIDFLVKGAGNTYSFLDMNSVLLDMEDIIDSREQTRKMFYWHGNKNPYIRAKHESKYNKHIKLTFLDRKIEYIRHYHESCNHVYREDHLTMNDVPITVKDLKKIINAIVEQYGDGIRKHIINSNMFGDQIIVPKCLMPPKRGF